MNLLYGGIGMNDFKKMWDFPVKEGVTFQNANRIHPLMQTRVEKLIRSIRKDDNVRLPVCIRRSTGRG